MVAKVRVTSLETELPKGQMKVMGPVRELHLRTGFGRSANGIFIMHLHPGQCQMVQLPLIGHRGLCEGVTSEVLLHSMGRA